MAAPHSTLFDCIPDTFDAPTPSLLVVALPDDAPPAAPLPKNPRFVDLAGRPFGRWTVLYYVRTRHWFCLCVCGRMKTVNASTLIGGTSVSCGCYQKPFARANFAKASEANVKHRMCNSPEYGSWKAMMARCYNKNAVGYENYGGRGIKVCERWQGEDGFANFLADVGVRPSPKHSLDRINNNGPYSPENCRWATKKEQASNRRTSRNLTLNGVTKPFCTWAKDIGLSPLALRGRLKRGWPLHEALTMPPLK